MRTSVLAAATLLTAAAALSDERAVIDAAALSARLQQHDSSLVVLDVRTPQEFAVGHIPGALNIPYDQLPARILELPDAADKDVVLYCATGKRTRMAIDRLREHGYSRLLHLEGDFADWQLVGRKVERP